MKNFHRAGLTLATALALTAVFLISPALAARNLALNRPVKTSSKSQWSPADDPQGSVDGVKNGRYGFHTQSDESPYWEVDLGEECVLTEVRVFNREDCCQERARNINMFTSLDGQDWRGIYAHDGKVFHGLRGGPLKVPLEFVRARYVRLALSEPNYFHLDEVEIIGARLSDPAGPGIPGSDSRTAQAQTPAVASPTPPKPPAPPRAGGVRNLALNRPARQSSRSPWSTPTDPQGAVDGVKNGRFGFHTNSQKNPWWQVDLGSICTLKELRVYNREDCCQDRAKNLNVYLSNDGRSWRRVYDRGGRVFGGVKGGPLRLNMADSQARHVRLQLNEVNWFHLDEVEIYGLAGTPGALPPAVTPPTPPAPPAVKPPSAARSVNLARGARVMARGPHGNRAHLLTDGRMPGQGTVWNGPESVSWQGTSTYFVVDLGRPCLVRDLVIQVDNNDDYQIDYSTDGRSFRHLAKIRREHGEVGWGLDTLSSRPGDQDYVAALSFQPVRARYIKVYATGGDNSYSVTEVQVWGEPL